jgi:hypothetical protein
MPSATNAHQRVAANIRGASQTPAAAFQAPVASCGIPGITLPPEAAREQPSHPTRLNVVPTSLSIRCVWPMSPPVNRQSTGWSLRPAG